VTSAQNGGCTCNKEKQLTRTERCRHFTLELRDQAAIFACFPWQVGISTESLYKLKLIGYCLLKRHHSRQVCHSTWTLEALPFKTCDLFCLLLLLSTASSFTCSAQRKPNQAEAPLERLMISRRTLANSLQTKRLNFAKQPPRCARLMEQMSSLYPDEGLELVFDSLAGFNLVYPPI